ncbi:serine/threonine-protein kinase, partial [Paractinoplanes ferrugineus]|uniref:serine/threonine-protein kinase n=1 Tax=Paractinoplanes ferrugineus TaxID=113564 RepID=UPI001942049D
MTRALLPNDPRRLGDYELLGRLGEGGMGAVYLGRRPGGRLVAVKVIRPEYAWDTEFRGRFRSEVNRAREVPGFCTAAVLDADPDHATPYLVVEYVDGPSLHEVIKQEGPLSGGTLHSVAVGVATALAAIHGAGVIHRDLKPQNVLFSLGTPKVIDFGIARALEATSRHTRTDQMVGTVGYMAPERFDDRDSGPPADVFAWGVLVAFAATGRTPFRGDSPAATAGRILTQPPDLTGLDGPLRELVASALAKEPADRPTAHELLDRLVASGPSGELARRPELQAAASAVAALPAERVRTDARPGRRRPGRVLVAAAVAAIVLVGGGLLGMHMLATLRADPASFRDGASSGPAAAASGTAGRPPAVAAATGVQRPTLIDRLDRPGQWKPTPVDEDAAGWCSFKNNRMVATTNLSGVYECTGPTETFGGEQTIEVDATVLDQGACAMIWFRVVDTSGYQASFCRADVRLGLNDDGEVKGERKAASAAFRPGRTHRAGVAVRGDTAYLTVDGTTALTMPLTDPQLAAGRVQFGALNDANDGSSSAAFADAELRSPTVGRPPKFADLLGKGPVTSAAKLYSYDSAADAAVVEPVLYLSGPDYCTLFKLKSDDEKCEQETAIVESHLRLSIPVRAEPAFATWEDADGEGRCVGTMTGGGTCPIKEPEFTGWLRENPQALIGISTSGGVVTRLAEMYSP